jgi:hypothetical protein
MTEAGIGLDAGTSLPHGSSSPFSPITPIGDRQPLSAQNQTRWGGFDFVDSSGPIYSMYMEMAEEEDKKMTESWKADAEGILVFVRLHLLVS